jgi:hypothetical protein
LDFPFQPQLVFNRAPLRIGQFSAMAGCAERSLKPLKLPRLQASHPAYTEPGKLADMLLGGHAAAAGGLSRR